MQPNLSGVEVEWLVLQEFGGVIAAGPFAGMRYLHSSVGSMLAPKILGTYEMELHGVLEHVIQQPYDLVVDVGSAEGYYAVGLALRMPTVQVIAFDLDGQARRLLCSLASLNQVAERIEVREECTHSDFNQWLGRNVLVICDVEGAEDALLDPEKAPGLQHVDLLVEVHDGDEGGIRNRLQSRFRPSHVVEWIRSRERSDSDAAISTWLHAPHARRLAVDEKRRLGLSWLWMKRRTAS